MSAMQQMLLGGDGLRMVRTVTVGFVSGFVGFVCDLGGAGSTTLISGTLTPYGTCRIASLQDGNDFQINFSGTSPPANVITGVNVWDDLDVKRTYLVSAAVSNNIVGSHRIMTWGTGTNEVWTGANATPRRVEFF